MTPVHIGIPVHDELDWLPHTLSALANQEDAHFKVWICVNQPREYWNDPAHAEVTRSNQRTLSWLAETRFPFPLTLLAALEPDQAPPFKRAGVGWARRHLFDAISKTTSKQSLCISLDADTHVPANYVAEIRRAFAACPNAVALAVPYYHPLPQDASAARHILRYEIYLRYYQLSLWRIGSPYAYMPIGSGLAFRLDAYRRMGGMPPRKAGEDFYFLQQMRKIGPVIRWINSRVEPAARPSARNPFGTGPLMGEVDLSLQNKRYPFYAQQSFDRLRASFVLFPKLHETDIPMPIDDFLQGERGGTAAFGRIRRNFADRGLFIKACHERMDGLRTLRFLRYEEARRGGGESDAFRVNALLEKLKKTPISLDFQTQSIDELDRVRNTLYAYESEFQQRFSENWDPKMRW